MSRLIVRLLTLAVFLLVVPTVFAQRERDTYTGNSLTFEVNGEVRLTDIGCVGGGCAGSPGKI